MRLPRHHLVRVGCLTRAQHVRRREHESSRDQCGRGGGRAERARNGTNTAFFWSETLGMRQLPVPGGAWAYGVSAVRSDGTRLVVGTGGNRSGALVWVVRNP